MINKTPITLMVKGGMITTYVMSGLKYTVECGKNA